MQHVTVRVPASTSNLGPGFDCLGVALQLYNEVSVARGDGGALSPMIRRAASEFFTATKCQRFPFSCTVRGDVPVARGLGSSATLRLGLLRGLNLIAQTNLSRADLFALAAQLEAHPDNAAPASVGGFTVTRGLHVQRFDVSARLKFVLLVPDFEVATGKARALLPEKIATAGAITNISNAAAITAAFAARDYEKLRGCFADALHQPYRKKLVPFLDDVIEAAANAGALGAFLSGSGSAICAVTLTQARDVGRAMLQASKLKKADITITAADNEGARVITEKKRPR
ncbi:MAG: homoserine kinase [Chthoniobacterales bacterium]